MRLNRTNKENDEDEKNNEEDEKEEKEVEEEEEEEDEEKGKSKIKQKQQNQKNKKKEKEKEKEVEEEEEEIEENQEENEYEDNHKKQMISDSKFEKIKGKKLIKFPNFQQPEPCVDKNKTLLKILLSIVGVYISLLIIVNVVVAIVKRRKKKNMKVNFDNDEVRILNAMDTNRFSKLRDDLLISYCTEGILNLNKFYDENVEQKTYALPDT